MYLLKICDNCAREKCSMCPIGKMSSIVVNLGYTILKYIKKSERAKVKKN
jgi:hypothetical protein